MNRSSLFAGLFALSTLGVGCTPGTELDQESLQGADESVDSEAALTGSVPVGSTLKTTADLNLRKGPSTSKACLFQKPVVVLANELSLNCTHRVECNAH